MIADPFQQFDACCCSPSPVDPVDEGNNGERGREEESEADESIVDEDEKEEEEGSLSVDSLKQTLDESPRTQ